MKKPNVSDEIAPQEEKKSPSKDETAGLPVGGMKYSTLTGVWNIVRNVTILMTLLGLLFAGYFFIENRYALFKELRGVSRQVLKLDLRFQIANKNVEIRNADELLISKEKYLKESYSKDFAQEIGNLREKKKNYDSELEELEFRLKNLLLKEDDNVLERVRP